MGLGNVTPLRISPHLKIVCCESFGNGEHFEGPTGAVDNRGIHRRLDGTTLP
jgi:hypothetical protein